MASFGSHGLGVLTPTALAIFDSNNFQVEAINWLGPIAPPQPTVQGHETGVPKESKPSFLVISRNGGTSRDGFITRLIAVPVFLPMPSPVEESFRKHEPIFSPNLDSCVKMARMSAGRTPVL